VDSSEESSYFLQGRHVRRERKKCLCTSRHFKSYLEISSDVHNCTDARLEYPYDRVVIRWKLGGMSLVGVTAHGSPSGPLQFERLEAALAARFHRS
jgi:hypothetical protein